MPAAQAAGEPVQVLAGAVEFPGTRDPGSAGPGGGVHEHSAHGDVGAFGPSGRAQDHGVLICPPGAAIVQRFAGGAQGGAGDLGRGFDVAGGQHGGGDVLFGGR